MISLKEPVTSQFSFEGWSLTFDSKIEHHKYVDISGYGIQFIVNGVKYDLFHNRVGMTRIFISEGVGYLRDIPFHAGTIGLLPDCIRFEKV